MIKIENESRSKLSETEVIEFFAHRAVCAHNPLKAFVECVCVCLIAL